MFHDNALAGWTRLSVLLHASIAPSSDQSAALHTGTDHHTVARLCHYVKGSCFLDNAVDQSTLYRPATLTMNACTLDLGRSENCLRAGVLQSSRKMKVLLPRASLICCAQSSRSKMKSAAIIVREGIIGFKHKALERRRSFCEGIMAKSSTWRGLDGRNLQSMFMMVIVKLS